MQSNTPIKLQQELAVDAIFEMMQQNRLAYELFYKNTDHQKNKLFLICPTSHLEPLIRKHFGGNVFFLSCFGTVLHPEDSAYYSELKDFIDNHQIEEVCLVQDLNASFLKNVLRKRSPSLYIEQELTVIYEQHQDAFGELRQFAAKKEYLAMLNLQQQARILKQCLKDPFLAKKAIRLRAFTCQPKQLLFSEVVVKTNRKTNS